MVLASITDMPSDALVVVAIAVTLLVLMGLKVFRPFNGHL